MKTILIPSDFSRNATTALKYAIRLGHMMKSNLVVFHCSQPPLYALVEGETEKQRDLIIRDDMNMKVKKLQSQVNRAYRYFGMKKTPERMQIVIELNPFLVEKTIEVARQFQADLIVMGTHGASGIKKYLFGSNTSIMISKSGIPVLAIPENHKFQKIETFLYASDLEDLNHELDRIIPFAEAAKARIDILHLGNEKIFTSARFKEAGSTIKKNHYKKIRLLGYTASAEHSLLDGLREYMDNHRQQWLVMFTKERSFWNKILPGSKTKNMSYSLKCPLLSFRKREPPTGNN